MIEFLLDMLMGLIIMRMGYNLGHYSEKVHLRRNLILLRTALMAGLETEKLDERHTYSIATLDTLIEQVEVSAKQGHPITHRIVTWGNG